MAPRNSTSFTCVSCPPPWFSVPPRFAASGGGALYHTGDLRLNDTRFEANQALVEGMAVASLGELFQAENVTFEKNNLYCSAGKYSYDKDTESVRRLC